MALAQAGGCGVQHSRVRRGARQEPPPENSGDADPSAPALAVPPSPVAHSTYCPAAREYFVSVLFSRGWDLPTAASPGASAVRT